RRADRSRRGCSSVWASSLRIALDPLQAGPRARRLAGVLGFEPRNGGTKNRCLTAWRHPKARGGHLKAPARRCNRGCYDAAEAPFLTVDGPRCAAQTAAL